MRYIIILIISICMLTGYVKTVSAGSDKIISGTRVVNLGESKESVRDKWGEPDEIKQIGVDEVGLVKEEWLYRGRYPIIPVDDQYLSQTKRLIFTGDNLTGYERGDHSKPAAKADKETDE